MNKTKRLLIFLTLLFGYSTFTTLIMALVTMLTGKEVFGINVIHVGFFLAGYYFNNFLTKIAFSLVDKVYP